MGSLPKASVPGYVFQQVDHVGKPEEGSAGQQQAYAPRQYNGHQGED